MLDTLNPAQRDAVRTLAGPLLVLAGAGSGKTRVVTHRIAELVRRGTPAERILAVTFTNKAAAEMQQRTAALAKSKAKTRPEISTFHSLCVRILRRHARRLGYPERFAIYDRQDQEAAARTALREIRVGDEALRPGDLVNIIGRWKTLSIRPEQAGAAAETDKEHLASMAYRRYQKALFLAGAMDFDDLLLCTEDLFGQFGDVRSAEAARFDHLLIDEYQDTNGPQYRIVKGLAAGHRNLCVVGDDDQSIYGWRGADVSHILQFKRDWPEAKVVRLEDNYRSSAAILELANRLISHNRQRHAKTLRAARPTGEKPCIMQCPDETAEATMVVADIRIRLRDLGLEPRDVAILFRTNEQPRAFETALRKAELPYTLVGGMSFFDRREVRDILAYFKLLATPTDELALRRIINTPARGIGEATQALLIKRAVAEGRPLWYSLGAASEVDGVSASAADAVLRFKGMIEQFQARLVRESPVAVAKALLGEIDYRQEIDRQYKAPDERQARWAAVEEVVNALAAYCQTAKRPTLGEFLDEIAVADRSSEEDKESKLKKNAIALMTLHSAKGLEFPHVYLVGMEEGLLPHRRSAAEEGAAIDEERRLCYVGVTRAQDRLTMSFAVTRMKWGKPRPTTPSRFLYELSGRTPSEPPRTDDAKSKPSPHKPKPRPRTARRKS